MMYLNREHTVIDEFSISDQRIYLTKMFKGEFRYYIIDFEGDHCYGHMWYRNEQKARKVFKDQIEFTKHLIKCREEEAIS